MPPLLLEHTPFLPLLKKGLLQRCIPAQGPNAKQMATKRKENTTNIINNLMTVKTNYSPLMMPSKEVEVTCDMTPKSGDGGWII